MTVSQTETILMVIILFMLYSHQLGSYFLKSDKIIQERLQCQ